MTDYIVKDTELTSVANAIRTAGGTNNSLTFPNGFVSAVENIGGGSGDSDFSTAQVTVTFAIPHTVLYIPWAWDMDEVSLSTCIIRESGTYPVILYKGTSIGAASYSSADDSVQVSIEVISGDAEASDEEVIITGDCTITIVSA